MGLTFGGWLILFSGLVAIGSLFLGWADMSFLFWNIGSMTGIAIGIAGVLALWLYPLYMSFAKKQMGRRMIVATWVFVVGIPVAVTININNKGGLLFDVDAGVGVTVFFLAGAILILGILADQLRYIWVRRAQATKNQCSIDRRQNQANGRCYWFHDDASQQVYVQVFHAIGCAKFSLEPSIAVVENNGLAPWVLGEAQDLLMHFEKQIRSRWRVPEPEIVTERNGIREGISGVTKKIRDAFSRFFSRVKAKSPHD